MNKNLIKAISSITCGVALVALVTTATVLSYPKKSTPVPEPKYQFDTVEKQFSGTSSWSSDHLVWDQSGSSDGMLKINLKGLNFTLDKVDLSTVYYEAGFSFPISCFDGSTKPTAAVNVNFTNLPDHEEGVTEIPAGFDMEFEQPNEDDTLTIKISFSKDYGEWKKSIDALKDYSFICGTNDVITSFDFGLKDKKGNIRMLNKSDSANPYVFNLDLTFNS